MDKIWDRKSFEAADLWPLWRGWKKRMTTQNRQKSRTLKKTKNFVGPAEINSTVLNSSIRVVSVGSVNQSKCCSFSFDNGEWSALLGIYRTILRSIKYHSWWQVVSISFWCEKTIQVQRKPTRKWGHIEIKYTASEKDHITSIEKNKTT